MLKIPNSNNSIACVSCATGYSSTFRARPKSISLKLIFGGTFVMRMSGQSLSGPGCTSTFRAAIEFCTQPAEERRRKRAAASCLSSMESFSGSMGTPQCSRRRMGLRYSGGGGREGMVRVGTVVMGESSSEESSAESSAWV